VSIDAALVEQQPAVPSSWLTPRLARSAPVHRWFVFPHSYAPELVEWLANELSLEEGATVLDPFCGAGTTLVEAQRMGLRSIGIDLLPLAVLASRTKTTRHRRAALSSAKKRAVASVRDARVAVPNGLLARAFEPEAFGRLAAALDTRASARDCIRLAVLRSARQFSRLVADGGWLREQEPELGPEHIGDVLDQAFAEMEEDLGAVPTLESTVLEGDARALPVASASVDAVITSPPYPNRHDYTRVFAVELELGFGIGARVKELRYRALRSHPEARRRNASNGYREPRAIEAVVGRVSERHDDARVARMLHGYFEDMFVVLREIHRVLKPGGRAALVVGNAQYCGIPVPVDELLADVSERAGLTVEQIVPLRYRGNSAQQMSVFGRRPSRESALVLQRP